MAKVKSRKRSTSSSSASDSGSHVSSDSASEEYRKRLKKLKKKIKKEERKAAKLLKRELKNEKKSLKKQKKAKRRFSSESPSQVINVIENNGDNIPSTNVPLGLMERSKAMASMTKEEWEKRQSIIRRVKDEETGRYRLIKGDGEVLEEIVSKERHREINRLATKADGDFFQSQTVDK